MYPGETDYDISRQAFSKKPRSQSEKRGFVCDPSAFSNLLKVDALVQSGVRITF
jgi:hypothetical protein